MVCCSLLAFPFALPAGFFGAHCFSSQALKSGGFGATVWATACTSSFYDISYSLNSLPKYVSFP